MRPTREQLEATIRAEGGVLTRVARRLDCSRPTLYKWIWQLDLQRVAGLDVAAAQAAVNGVVMVPPTYAKHTNKYVKPFAVSAPRLVLMEAETVPATREFKAARSVVLHESLWRWCRIEAVKRGCSASELIEGLISEAKGQDPTAEK